MPIGRNDPCICGSGKKFKKCCHNWETEWRQGIENSDCDQTIKNILLVVFDFIQENQFRGGCHMISAILFILISELGYEPIIKTGEVEANNIIFDHSWLEIDNKVIDLTLMSTLVEDMRLPPIVMNKSVASGLETTYQYGKSTNLDEDTQLALSLSIGKYIQDGKACNSYVFLESIARKVGIQIDNTDFFLEKYMKSFRRCAVATH